MGRSVIAFSTCVSGLCYFAIPTDRCLASGCELKVSRVDPHDEEYCVDTCQEFWLEANGDCPDEGEFNWDVGSLEELDRIDGVDWSKVKLRPTSKAGATVVAVTFRGTVSTSWTIVWDLTSAGALWQEFLQYGGCGPCDQSLGALSDGFGNAMTIWCKKRHPEDSKCICQLVSEYNGTMVGHCDYTGGDQEICVAWLDGGTRLHKIRHRIVEMGIAEGEPNLIDWEVYLYCCPPSLGPEEYPRQGDQCPPWYYENDGEESAAEDMCPP